MWPLLFLGGAVVYYAVSIAVASAKDVQARAGQERILTRQQAQMFAARLIGKKATVSQDGKSILIGNDFAPLGTKDAGQWLFENNIISDIFVLTPVQGYFGEARMGTNFEDTNLNGVIFKRGVFS